MAEMKTDKFVLVDLETTGLNEKVDMPLEIGVIVADSDLQIEAEARWAIRQVGWLERIMENPLVYEMHTKSGLIREIQALPELMPRAGGQRMDYSSNIISLLVWRWLTEELGIEAGVYPMVGSSVHFDRRFMDEWLSMAHAFFHYRNIDVSSVRSLCSAFNPEVYAVLKSDARFQKENSAHRALPDARTTLAELTFFRDHFLVCAELNDVLEYVGDKDDMR